MAGIRTITLEEYLAFVEPLKPEEFITFDICPNSSMIALERSDFDDNDRWVEFVSRYVRTADHTRSTYYLERMSPLLKEDLIWAIASLWWESKDEREKDGLKSVLKQDLQIDPKDIKKRSDVGDEIDKGKGSAALGASYYQDFDKIRHSRYLLYSSQFSATLALPFRIREDARIAPSFSVDAGLISGSRKLEGTKEEDLDYFAGVLTCGVDARALRSDTWNIGGLVALLRRIDGPSGFSYFDATWNAYANANHLFGSPVDLMLTVSGMNQLFTPPAEEEHYQRDTDQYAVDVPVAVVLSNMWSLIGVYNYLFNHQILYFSTEDREQHTGALKARRRNADGYQDGGVNFSSEKRQRKRKANGTEVADRVERLKVGLGGEYFVSFGGGKSLQVALNLTAVDSSGDLDATFFEYSLASTVYLSVLKDVELSLTGNLIHDLIYQKGREFELTYGLQIGPTWHILKGLSLIGSGIFQQTKSKGGLNDDNVNIGGNLTLSNALSLAGREFNIDLTGNAGRYFDGENFDETYWTAALMFKALF